MTTPIKPFCDLTGKVALITGAGSGIGRATAIALARQGATVVATDMNPQALAATLSAATAEGLHMHATLPLDLTRAEDARQAVTQAVAHGGRLDILANIAGFTAPFVPFEKTDLEQHWRYTLKGELDLVFLVTQAAWPHMISGGGGSVINIGSAVAHMGFEDMPALPHIAGKGAVVAMTRQLAAEGARHGIRVNTVSPGFIVTPQSAPALELPGVKEHLHRNLFMRRLGQPEDVASCIVFLASDESSWVTAAEYMVDGGSTSK